MKRYRVMNMDDALVGMQLYRDLLDRAGNVLLPAQTVLNAGQIGSLRRRDIDVVLVVDDTASPEQLANERIRVTQRLEHLFRYCKAGPATVMLRTAVEAYRLERL